MAVSDRAGSEWTVVDKDDDMTPAEREELHATIDRSIEQSDRGETVPWDEALAWLRAQRSKLPRR